MMQVPHRNKNNHSLNLFISYDLKRSLTGLATRTDRTIADIVRLLLKLGMPLLEGMLAAEAELLRQQSDLCERLRMHRSSVEDSMAAANRAENHPNKDS